MIIRSFECRPSGAGIFSCDESRGSRPWLLAFAPLGLFEAAILGARQQPLIFA